MCRNKGVRRKEGRLFFLLLAWICWLFAGSFSYDWLMELLIPFERGTWRVQSRSKYQKKKSLLWKKLFFNLNSFTHLFTTILILRITCVFLCSSKLCSSSSCCCCFIIIIFMVKLDVNNRFVLDCSILLLVLSRFSPFFIIICVLYISLPRYMRTSVRLCLQEMGRKWFVFAAGASVIFIESEKHWLHRDRYCAVLWRWTSFFPHRLFACA